MIACVTCNYHILDNNLHYLNLVILWGFNTYKLGL